MVSTIAALALTFGLASASALPPLPGKDAPLNVTSASSTLTTESSVPATCADVTSTSTVTNDYPNTVYEQVTTYLPTSTRGTVTIYTSLANTTASYNAGVWTESNIVHNIGTTTQTLFEEVTTGLCTSTETIAAESTSTVYTGSYTPTPLPTYCPTSVHYEYIYSGDDVTETNTYTSQPLVTITTTVSTLYTEYYHESTTTIDVPVSEFEWATATTTRTIASDCTETSYTATASTTTTQSAKCAPTNFITGINGVSNVDGLDAVNLWQKQDPANKDASTCCQVCVEDEDCVAMDFYSGCSLYRGSDCGKSVGIRYSFPGDTGYLAQAGCGAIVIKNN